MAASHGWSLDGVSMFELVPLEADPAKQQSLLHPSEVELGETTALIMQKVTEVRPTVWSSTPWPSSGCWRRMRSATGARF
jgi:hypothetical protein